MFYWLIPYLVAYNSSDAGNWKYGPEHVFKVEVRMDLVKEDMLPIYINYDMLMPCRPINTSAIQCRIESVTTERWKVGYDVYRYPADPPTPREWPANQVFEVGFTDDGVETIRLLNDSDNTQLEMIRAIVAPLNVGIDLSKMINDNSNYMENNCNTNVNVSSRLKSDEHTWKPAKTIDGYSFDVPAFNGKRTDRPIFIEKQRDLNDCANKTTYLFGSPSSTDNATERNEILSQILFSRSMITLGEKGFSAFTRKIGTIEMRPRGVADMKVSLRFNEILRVSLISIRPATEELRSIESSTNTGEDDVSKTR